MGAIGDNGNNGDNSDHDDSMVTHWRDNGDDGFIGANRACLCRLFFQRVGIWPPLASPRVAIFEFGVATLFFIKRYRKRMFNLHFMLLSKSQKSL